MNMFENNGAEFSECGKYRYKLWRIWDDKLPLAMCIGLNPSNANSDKDDPTIGILKRMLTKLRYGGFYMMNLYSFVSTNPDNLIESDANEKKENCLRLIGTSKKCDVNIYAWGNFKQAIDMGNFVSGILGDAKCFGKSAKGAPLHPLALMYNGTQSNPKLIKF